MRKPARTDYAERIERVAAHIRANLDAPLCLDDLAEIACLSRFHWHRVYRGLLGETISQTVRRLRLNRAAFELSNGHDSLAVIAERAGYANPRAFSKAFRDDYGMPPQRYRAEGGHRRYDDPNWKEQAAMYDIRLSREEPATIVGLPHHGSYMEINAAFGRLTTRLSTLDGDAPATVGMAAVYFDDPDLTPEAELKSFAGVMLADNVEAPDGLERYEMPGGRYAILTHKGPYSELSKAYAFLFGPWLKETDVVPRPVPVVERYLNTPVSAAPKDLLTEIMLAIE